MTPHLQGAIAIYDDPRQLLDRLGQSPLFTATWKSIGEWPSTPSQNGRSKRLRHRGIQTLTTVVDRNADTTRPRHWERVDTAALWRRFRPRCCSTELLRTCPWPLSSRGMATPRLPTRAQFGAGATDKHLIYEGLSRVAADAVLVGARTVHPEAFFSVWHPELIALRESLGFPRHPAQVVVSKRGHVDLASLLFNVPDVPVFLIGGEPVLPPS